MGGAVSAGEDNSELVGNLKEAGYIKSPEIEHVFKSVDRGDYFPEGTKQHAYKDMAWKHGNIHLSAPCIYSEVMELLEFRKGLSFLNIGSGTGYLSTMAGLLLGPCGTNHGVEFFEDVIQFAYKMLDQFLCKNLAFEGINFCEPVFVVGNGLCISSTYRQYDRVYCGAACPNEYEDYMKSLVKVGGILVMPFREKLCKMKRLNSTEWETENVLPVSFAPLLPLSKDTLQQIEISSNPRSLQDLSRLRIRRSLRSTGQGRITELPLPESLLLYLNYFRDSNIR